MPLQAEPVTPPFNLAVRNAVDAAVDLAGNGKKASVEVILRTTDTAGGAGQLVQEQHHNLAPDDKGAIDIGSDVANYRADGKETNAGVVGVSSATVGNNPAERAVLKNQLTEEVTKEAARQLNSYCGPDKECPKETTYSVTATKYPDTESTFGNADTTTGSCYPGEYCCCCGEC